MIENTETFEINYVDASSLCTFDRCPARYLFQRLMGLSHPDANLMVVNYGTDIHLAVPHCYQEDDSCVEVASQVFAKSWMGRGYGNDNKARNCARARESLLEFHRLHKPSTCSHTICPISKDISAPTADVISANELPFAMDIEGPLPFIGRIDAVVESKANGKIWALDYKTSSEVSTRYFNNFEGCPQVVGYTLAVQTVLGFDAQGMIIDAIRVSPKNVESLLSPIYVNEHQIRLFVEWANRKAEQILKCNEDRTWHQDISKCAPYSTFYQPGRFCEFQDLCMLGKWEEMLPFYKKSKPFHPFVVNKGA